MHDDITRMNEETLKLNAETHLLLAKRLNREAKYPWLVAVPTILSALAGALTVLGTIWLLT